VPVKRDEVQDLIDKGDAIGALCLAVRLAGGTMTLYGQPIDETDLRRAARESVVQRLGRLLMANHGDEDPRQP
jgi:hypothetical protein